MVLRAMGQRTAGETLVEIFGAFLEKRAWTQVALAKRCGVGVKALRKRRTGHPKPQLARLRRRRRAA